MAANTSPFSFYAGRRVCVTGGAGFIGSHLCEALVAVGARVSVIDDFSNGRIENLQAIKDQCQVISGSILEPNALARAMRDCELVFHQAAIASVPRSVKEPALYFQVNATGTLQVLEAARLLNVRRVIYAASSSAYGDRTELPKVESMSPLPLSPYASAKFAGEHLLRTYCHCYGMQGVSLRYFNIFGPRQRPDSPYAAVIPCFAQAFIDGRRPVVYGDGTQTRDFTHVANAVHANLLAGACPNPLHGEHLNIACGASFSLRELLAEIASFFDRAPEADFAAPRIGEVQHSLASIDLAKAVIGYQPVVDFKTGLRQTLQSFQVQRSS